jgi:NAD(P)H-dependent FMN reductase
VDLAQVALPHLDEAIPPSVGQYQHDHTRKWADFVAKLDGFVVVTPEYNHSIPGVLKNAFDYLYAEWNNKSLGIVSYGSAGGTRAAEHLRLIAGELQLADVRQQVTLSLATDFENYSTFTPAPYHLAELDTLLGQVNDWASALASLRSHPAH